MKDIFLLKTSRLHKILLIFAMFLILGILEYSTPNDYVFGYLYSGAILLVNSWFGEIATVKATSVAVLLTILNIWVPGGQTIKTSTIASRAIAAIALIFTGFLSQRLRHSEKSTVQTREKLDFQEQLLELREDFVYILADDLKTPLLGAIEAIKAFQQEKLGPLLPSQQQVLATIVRSHENSLLFVETLLDVYRNEIDGLKLNLAPVNLTLLVQEVNNSLTELAASRRVYLKCNCANTDVKPKLWVLGDTLEVKKVLTNLLINAINRLKGIAANKLVLALRSVAIGASWWDEIATKEILAKFEFYISQSQGENEYLIENTLTIREQEILSLIAQGKSNQEIADILVISLGTVKVHVHAILKKLEVNDRTQAAIIALQKGLIKSNTIKKDD